MMVKNRIRRWQEGDIIGLWNSVMDGAGQPSSKCTVRKKGSPESLRESNARRARQTMKDGLYRKAIQSLGSDGLAPPSVKNQAVMLSKHPQAPPPPEPTIPPPTAVQATIEDVARALKSFPNGSASGPSGLRANHLKEAAFCPSPDRAIYALRSLSGVVNLMCAGKVPQAVVPYLCGATLLTSQKRDGGLRPIAVGEVLRRLSSKCISKAVRSEVFEVLTPLQVGVGVQGGCKSIVHAVSLVQEDSNISPELKWTLLLDF